MSKDETLYCDFCGKSQHEVRKLIAGPRVFICDECVELCGEIIDEEVIGIAATKVLKPLTIERIPVGVSQLSPNAADILKEVGSVNGMTAFDLLRRIEKAIISLSVEQFRTEATTTIEKTQARLHDIEIELAKLSTNPDAALLLTLIFELGQPLTDATLVDEIRKVTIPIRQRIFGDDSRSVSQQMTAFAELQAEKTELCDQLESWQKYLASLPEPESDEAAGAESS